MMTLLKAGAVFGVTMVAFELTKTMGRDKLGLKGDVLPALVGGVGAVAVGALATGLIR